MTSLRSPVTSPELRLGTLRRVVLIAAADWAAVSELLHRSSRDLYKAVNAE